MHVTSPQISTTGTPSFTTPACWRQLFGISVLGKIFHTVWIIKWGASAKQCGDRPVIHSSIGTDALETRAACLSDRLSRAIDNLQWENFSIYSFCCHCTFPPPLIPLSNPSSFNSVSSGWGDFMPEPPACSSLWYRCSLCLLWGEDGEAWGERLRCFNLNRSLKS